MIYLSAHYRLCEIYTNQLPNHALLSYQPHRLPTKPAQSTNKIFANACQFYDHLRSAVPKNMSFSFAI